jgi:rhamnose utilization protein RhaD (predicted bifunctional aldolase and dehydrogenase)
VEKPATVAELIARSNRLGADPTITNYAGGNTSAKGVDRDPVTGADVELVWVKGSGGDLGTLTPAGLAVLRLTGCGRCRRLPAARRSPIPPRPGCSTPAPVPGTTRS